MRVLSVRPKGLQGKTISDTADALKKHSAFTGFSLFLSYNKRMKSEKWDILHSSLLSIHFKSVFGTDVGGLEHLGYFGVDLRGEVFFLHLALVAAALLADADQTF